MYLPSRHAVRRSEPRPVLPQPEQSDRTLYEAEDLPVKIHMQPHRCASDPRLKLDLRAVLPPSVGRTPKTQAKPPEFTAMSPQFPSLPQSPAKVDRGKVRELLRRASSDLMGIQSSPGSGENQKAVVKPVTDGAKRQGKVQALTLSLAMTISPKAVKRHIRMPSFKSAESSPHYQDFLRRVGTAAKVRATPHIRSLWSKPHLRLK